LQRKSENEKKKKIKDKQTKRGVELGTVANRATIIIPKKHARAQFTTAWTPIAIKEIGDKFH